MAVLGELLFYRRDRVGLDDVLRHQVDLLRGRVDELPDELFANNTDEEVAAHVAGKCAIQSLKLDLAAAKANVEEVQVEVHDRWGYERGPIRVPGLRATKSIPFTGEEDLWRLRTNPWNMNPPRGDIRGRNLIIGIEVAAQQADEAAKYIEDTIAQLLEYLQRQAAQLAPYNAGLAGNAMQWIKMRRARLGTANDLLKKLGG
ncbi:MULTISPECIES: hypothetical protein [Rhodopseudomonas]|nr:MULTISPECIES: hypothetical protein [Rhodopseudomonas]MDF3813229.1 hypothetical protein [Rhodopseudomonas sp. BAL398]WOK21004.1 hypothetical protein RBJ75_28875 [Rhodopseudomonas sp. BAL398]